MHSISLLGLNDPCNAFGLGPLNVNNTLFARRKLHREPLISLMSPGRFRLIIVCFIISGFPHCLNVGDTVIDLRHTINKVVLCTFKAEDNGDFTGHY